MQATIGWLILALGGVLYLAQLVSSLDFKLAQRLGIQEKPEQTDALVQTAENYTAYWDLATLAGMPLAGLLMLIDHAAWPVVALAAGAIYLDAAGREAAKYLSFRHQGLRLGTASQQKWFFASYLLMGFIGILVMAYSIARLV